MRREFSLFCKLASVCRLCALLHAKMCGRLLRLVKSCSKVNAVSKYGDTQHRNKAVSPLTKHPCYLCTMIMINDTLVSDQVIEEQFVCDLLKCKGGCCVDGDAGAPLENGELKELADAWKAVMPYLSKESQQEIERKGLYVYDREFGWVTPTVSAGMCAFGIVDEKGIVKCGIEKAYNDGKVFWKKPISCHLFPIKIKKSKSGKSDLVNYEPREDLCSAACKLGKKLKVPVYVFLKEALVRKYGEEFYESLSATAAHNFSI